MMWMMDRLLIQFIMRNNSLRQQLAENNRQNARIFKKIGRFAAFEDPPVALSSTSGQYQRYRNNCDQHSEIQWLEGVVGEMRAYKDEQRGQGCVKGTINNSMSYGGKTRGVSQEKIENKKGEREGKQVKEKVVEEGRRSGKKIKFEIIANKQNKVPLGKKNSNVSTGRSNEKIKNKINKKISQQSVALDKQWEDKIDKLALKGKNNNKQVFLDIDKIITVPSFNQKYTNIGQQAQKNLWQPEDTAEVSHGLHSCLSRSYQQPKKSIGKIIKNNNKTEQAVQPSMLSTFVSKQKKPQPIATKNNHEKVYIKLQTEKLSKYLVQSGVNEEKNQEDKLEIQEYKKYCPTKRGDRICVKLVVPGPSVGGEEILCDKTEVIERKKNVERNMKTCLPQKNMNLNQVSNKSPNIYQSYKKEKGKLHKNTINPVIIKMRSKSQQRKLNQCPRVLNNIQSTNQQRKAEEKDILPTFNIKNINQDQLKSVNKVENLFNDINFGQKSVFQKQKTQKTQKKSNNKMDKSQKLFTLHSDHEEASQQSLIQHSFRLQDDEMHKQQFGDNKDHAKYLQISEQQICIRPMETQQLVFSSIDELEEPIKVQSKQLQSLQLHTDSSKQNYKSQLTQLFYYLDENKRGFLTSSNCKAESLTQDLKLLFSSILNQIKSKKHTYNIDQFISEGQAVLKIKQQLYSSSKHIYKSTLISQVLRQNISILKKKSPFQFLKHTHTHSYFDTNQNSRRDNSMDNHSIVISKVVVKEKEKEKPKEYRLRFESKLQSETSRMDLQQPQIFIQKKYGISTEKIELPPTQKSNYYSSRAQGYLHELQRNFRI